MLGFLYQYHIGDITSTDVLRYSMNYGPEKFLKETKIIEKNKLDVVVLKNRTKDLEKYINSIEFDYDEIFLIAENHSWQGRSTILSNNEIKKLGIKSSYWAFEKEPQIHEKINLVQNTFPNTDIYPILIKDFVKYEDLNLLAEQISNLNKNILVISLADLSNTYNENLSLFQDEVSLKVIQSSKDFSKINVDSIPVIKLALLLTDELKLYGNEIEELEKPLSILAFGDMMLGRYVRTLMDRNGQDYIFKNIAGEDNEFFKGTDIVFGNLEGPIKGKGRSGGTSMVFTFNEDIADFLKRYNFNLVSIANNHAVDAGWDGRETTIDELNKSGVNWCGHPSESDPYSVFYQDNYAFVCLHDVSFKLDDVEAIELIKEVRKSESSYSYNTLGK